jgi:hypothetical protein
MAISDTAAVLAMLKVYYAKEGVENLMFRNSPVLKALTKTRVEGKVQNFAAMFGRGGACSGNFLKAISLANTVSKNVEFSVTPGQLFSVYTMNAKEVQASKSNRGAYMKIAGSRMFAASESFRKTMGAALYGSGYGEICHAPTTALTANTDADIVLPTHAIMKIDIGSELEVVATKNATSVLATLEVKAINGNTVTVSPDTTYTPSATDIIRLAGSVDANGKPVLPVGLDGWLPVLGGRTGAGWTSYIGTDFFAVNRSAAADRLAGAFYSSIGTSDRKVDTVQKALQIARRQGSAADLIIMNDEDFLAFANEIETDNTYFTQTSTKARREANVGFDKFSASFSTNYIENIVDDPLCPKGRGYILDKSAVEIWSYTNAEKIADGVEGNNPGKPDPMGSDDSGKENDPYGLIVDDYLNIQPGQNTADGPASQITLQFYGSFVVTNPSVCAVFEFADSTDFAL